MRIRVSLAIALAGLLALSGTLFAASPTTTKPPAISCTIEYVDSPNQTFQVVDAQGNAIDPQPQIGDALQIGWTVVTGKGDVAELKMTHTGTIIKVAQNTNFTLKDLRTDTGGQDVFALTLGKVRTVAGKASGKDQFQIKTQSAVCGVRGSDVVVEFEDKIYTLEGVGYIMDAAGEALDVAQGFFVDAVTAFKAVEIPKDVLDGLTTEMKFIKLDVQEAMAINQAWQASLQAAPAPQGGTTAAPAPTPAAPPAPAANPFLDSIMAKLREILGMEIGSVTIGGVTWSKVVIQPTFAIGPLKAALYLPIIYQGDMFNPNDYYKPAGNDEWDFGGLLRPPLISADPVVVGLDVLTDLLLKIKYLEWGQQRDPFFFKVGNLNDITIGHGLIMRNFANDADFPAMRRVGLNLGLDFGGFGFEAMVNDAAAPDILGGRLYIRPIPGAKLALGFSSLLDLQAGKDWNVNAGGPAAVGDPIFINPGVDLDLPIFDSDFFRIVAFADGAAMLPYFRSSPSTALTGGVVIPPGFALNAIWDPGASLPIKNWGVAAGLFGNLIIRDFTWRLEFRDYTGAFIPQFYGSGYERQRSQFVQNVLTYLGNPSAAAYDTQTVGIFGEGGLTLAKLFSLNLSYFWPWAQDTMGNFTFGNDHFVAKFTLEQGVIPVVNVWGSVSYERTNFVPTILNEGTGAGLQLFDANTVVSATINYAVNTNVDVVLLYTTTAKRDASGNIIYPSDPTMTPLQKLLPELDTSLSIETQVHL